MPTTPPTLRRALRSVSVGAAGVVGAVVIAGCAAGDDIAEAPAGAEPAPVEVTSSAPATDPRVVRYADALAAGGFPEVIPPATLFTVGDGVCRQSASGTADAPILEKLQPIGAYGASRSGGALTADAATRLLLDAARGSFC